MTMHKALHPKDDVDRVYVPRKEGGILLASIEDRVDKSIQVIIQVTSVFFTPYRLGK